MFKKALRLILAAAITTTTSAFAGEVNIYSVYEAARLEPIFKPFVERTGIKVNIIYAPSVEIINRLETEGEATKADLHLDKDLVFQGAAQAKGLHQPFKSKIVEKNIPASLIESDKNWFIVFYRARVIMYNPNKVSLDELSTYEDLGSPKWKGRLCLRTSNNSYNEALGAFFLKHYGAEKTFSIFKSWVNNLAVAPIKGDTDIINAVAAGTCDVTVANSYYLAPLVKADVNFPVKPFFPNQNTTGAHINGVAVGLVKHAKNISEATMVMEYLSSAEVQAPVAAAFSQYPSNPEAALAPVLINFGKFKADETNVGEYSRYVEEARAIMKKAEYK